MTLSELGVTLQSEREKRGLTLQDVAERLRISTHVLRALEMGDMDALPHKAYAKGFIRSYATLLGLATDEIEACVASLSGASPSVPQPIATLDEAEEPTVPAGKLLACAIVLLLLAGGGYAAWHFNLLERMPSVEQIKTAIPLTAGGGNGPVDTAPAATQPKAGAKADGKQAAPKQVAAGKPVSGQTAPGQDASKPASAQTTPGQTMPNQSATGKAASPQSAPNQPASGQLAATPPASAQSTPASASEQPANMPRHHKIIVTATEDCWIHSNADKTNTRQFTLRKGDTFALTFAKSLEVKLGNAAGVRIRYNGNELPPAGKRGEIRTLVFPPVSQQ